jgi:hypothetical protein
MSRTESRYRKIKYCAYALLLVISFVLEHSRGTSLPFWSDGASSLPFFVASIALFEGPYAGGIFGFAAGIVASTHSPMAEGLSSMYFGLFGIVFGLIGAAYMRRVLVSAMLGGAACVLLQGVCRYIFYYGLLFGVPLAGGLRGIGIELLLSLIPGILVFYTVRAIHRRFDTSE